MKYRANIIAATAAIGLLWLSTSQAASVYLTPASANVLLSSGSATFELFMDFTGTPTVGGGIDLDVTGSATFATFTPSSYFLARDPFLSSHGVANADADYEVHFGDFAGLGGVNKLGDVQVNLTGIGPAAINLAINQFYGDFYGLDSQVMQVTLTGANINVVPLPATAWMLFTGIASVAGWSARRRIAR